MPPFARGAVLDNTTASPRPRKLRADAARNRQKLLDAAKALFAEGGAEGSLEAVAQRAGVGIGTLYRHFPTRQALFEAVYRHEVDQLVALAGELATGLPPLEALRLWMRANVEFVATKKGMSQALAIAVSASSELSVTSMGQLSQALGLLLARAASAGVIRPDIGAEDIVRTILGLCYMHSKPGWQSHVLRLVDVFADGLRLPAGRE